MPWPFFARRLLVFIVWSQFLHYFTLLSFYNFDPWNTRFSWRAVRLNYVTNFNVFSHTAKYNPSHISIVSSIMSLLSSFLIIQLKLFGERVIKLKSKIVADLLVMRALIVQVAQLSLAEEVQWLSKHFSIISVWKHILPFRSKPSVVSW